jgi:hypothetical protein
MCVCMHAGYDPGREGSPKGSTDEVRLDLGLGYETGFAITALLLSYTLR